MSTSALAVTEKKVTTASRAPSRARLPARPLMVLRLRRPFSAKSMPQSGSHMNAKLFREHAKKPFHRIVETIHHPFFQGDDGIVGDGDVLRTDLRAALGDVAIADAVRLAQVLHAVLDVQRVHLQRRGID